MTGLLVVADDLSGAAETAGAIASGSRVVELRLRESTAARPAVLAVDTDSRSMSPSAAGLAAARAVLDRRPDHLVYKKIDSMLRGNIAAEVAALGRAGFGILVAAAVPRIGRTVREGVVHLDGIPLPEAPIWSTESQLPPVSIAAALGLPAIVFPISLVRSSGFDAAVIDALDRGLAPICDSETEEDLDAVAAMLLRLDTPPAVVGAGGLARSLAPLLALERTPGRFEVGAERIVLVVGTRAASASGQLDLLEGAGVRRIILRPGERIELPPTGDLAISFAAGDGDAVSQASALDEVADAVAALDGRSDLVLTGGATARRVLDRLGIDRLYVEREIEDGTVLSTTPGGTAVVTRPGSFGPPDGLVRVVSYLRGAQP